MKMIRMAQVMEQVSSERRRDRPDEDRYFADGCEPLLSPEGVQIGWYDPVTDQEYPF